MVIKGIIKTGEYFDSVTLMLVAKEVNTMQGVIDSAVVMGTQENKAILTASNMLLPEFDGAKDADLLIGIKAESEAFLEKAFVGIEDLFKKSRKKTDSSASSFAPKSLSGALEAMPEANLSLISVAGRYAAREAKKALDKGLHVMMFSDNVTVEDEIKLKKYAAEKGLFVMGPDCGTAIINGVPLAFANVIDCGDIGMVAASGTGLQEVSCVIGNNGAGISQAIGTGGRDVKKDVGGIMFLEAMRALNEDEETKIIVLVSKPPYTDVEQAIAHEIRKIKKPVVAILIGGNPQILKDAGAHTANTLEEAGMIAAALSKGQNINEIETSLNNKKSEIEKLAKELAPNCEGKFIRGLFSGGTLCDETQLILKDIVGFVHGNAPLNPELQLKDLWKSEKNTIVDMGEDEFTVGRPHPMIDFSLRNKRIVEEAKDKDVAVIMLDIVLGYGSNMKPAEEICPAIAEAKKIAPNKLVICSITGTKNDPQNKDFVKRELEKAGAIVMGSNAEASLLSGLIIKAKGE